MQYQRTDSTTMSDKYTRPRQFIPVSVIISTSGSLHPRPLSLRERRMSDPGNGDLWDCQRYSAESTVRIEKLALDKLRCRYSLVNRVKKGNQWKIRVFISFIFV